ncbi:MAG TPA: bifunctional YncE family protein/alkaline phosphatase family protein, partial [Candidatus Angelobacter sp.]|nr:bifunctional YncE family protein/alkaline phosphatase family protein [Candidatus Angelobacter sp.]
GFDDSPTQPIASGTHRFLWSVDTATMKATSFEDDAATYGLAEARDGTLYVAEGDGATHTDAIGIFTPSKGATPYTRSGTIPLNPSNPVDQPWGIALSPDGSKLYAAAFSTNTLITVDLASRSVAGRTQAGQFPYAVVVSADGQHVYVSNWGLYNQEADPRLQSLPGHPTLPIDPPPATVGGYNTDSESSVWTYSVAASGLPAPQVRTRIGRDLNGDDVIGGALPSALALSPDQRTLAVTASNDDLVQLLDVSTTVTTDALPSLTNSTLTTVMHPKRAVDMHVIAGGPTGAQPNALAWAPDGKELFVAEGGRNAIAVVDPSRVAAATNSLDPLPASGINRDAVSGRIPTGWYPSALALTPDGSRLFIADNEGLGSGPNGHVAGEEYDPNTLKGIVQAVDMRSACGNLPALSRLSDRDNGLTQAPTGRGTALGDGTVVPTAYGSPPSDKVKHVFLIIKENRTFDQELGDYKGAERDQTLVNYGQHITPNLHALTAKFANNDNFYATSEVSIDGHYSIDTGQINEFLQKVTSSNYAGKFPYGEWDTMPENLPQGGFIWNNAARGHVSTRIYGEGTYVVGVAPSELGAGVTANPSGGVSPALFAGNVQYDSRYPSQVDLTAPVVNGVSSHDPTGQAHDTLRTTAVPYDDEYRAKVFAQDMQAFAAASNNGANDGALPQLNVMILFDDHGNGDFPGKHTPETETAENDHALGEVVSTISTSPFWKSSAVFVTEDDTQGGQDHVDAHRTFGLVASPWVRPGRMSHQHVSFAAMIKTTDLILGLPPTSLQEMTASSLADYFVGAHGTPDLSPYTPQPNQVLPQTNRSVADARNPAELAAAQLALRLPQGIDKGGDILPAVERLQREGLMEAGDPNIVPQPAIQQHTLADASPSPADAVETDARGSLHSCVKPDASPVSDVEDLSTGVQAANVVGLPDTAAAQAATRAAEAAAVIALLAAAAGARRRRSRR